MSIAFAKSWVDRGIEKIIDARYFPEIYYLVDNWLSFSKRRHALSVGCGAGFLAASLAKSGWSMVCIDDTVPSLTSTKERFAKANLEGRFELTKLTKLPFQDKTFDVVFCVNALEFSEHPAHIMQEIYRVLRPNGQLILAAFNRYSLWASPSVIGKVRRDDSPRIMRAFTRHEFLSLLGKGRFKVLKTKDVAKYVPYEGRGGKIRWPWSGGFAILAEKTSKERRVNSAAETVIKKVR